MQAAENRSRKAFKPGPAQDKMVNSARLGVLSNMLGIHIKRHKDPGGMDINKFEAAEQTKNQIDKDTIEVVGTGF